MSRPTRMEFTITVRVPRRLGPEVRQALDDVVARFEPVTDKISSTVELVP